MAGELQVNYCNKLSQTSRSGRFTPGKEHLCALDRKSGGLQKPSGRDKHVFSATNLCEGNGHEHTTKQNVSLHIWYSHYHQHFHDHNKGCEHSHFCRHTTAQSSPVWARIPSGIWYQVLFAQVLTRTSSRYCCSTCRPDICSRPLE